MPYNRRAKGAVSRGMLEPRLSDTLFRGAYFGRFPASPLMTAVRKDAHNAVPGQ